jgi:L-amino acid N-acyltransferase
MNIVHCTRERHAAAILEILNDAIVTSTAIYDYQPRPTAWMAQWFETKAAGGYPVIGAEDASGTLMGFATYGEFRGRPAYKYSIEHSVYVHEKHRRKGVARRLLEELIGLARKQEYHLIVGGIDAANTASIAFHEALGFEHAGTIRHAGFKFGKWLDLAFYQLILETPAHPVDG